MTASSRAPKRLFWLDLDTTGKLKYRQKGGGKFTSLPAARDRQEELTAQGISSTLYTSGPIDWSPVDRAPLPFTLAQKNDAETIVDLFRITWDKAKASSSAPFVERLAEALFDHGLRPDPQTWEYRDIEVPTDSEIRQDLIDTHRLAHAEWLSSVRTKETRPRGTQYRFRNYFAESIITAGYRFPPKTAP